MAVSKYIIEEFSGAVQQLSTDYIKQPNEVVNALNGDFSTKLGAVQRRPGSAKLYSAVAAKPVLGGGIARFPTEHEPWVAVNNSGDTEAELSYWNGSAWVEIEDGLTPSSEVHMIDDLDEIWVSSYNETNDSIDASFTVDENHDVSYTRHLMFGPRARFFIEWNGSMWAANVEVAGTRYRDRVYKSSGPTGAITFIRSPQTDNLTEQTFYDNTPSMTSNTAPFGVVSASTSHVDNPAWRAFDKSTSTRWLTNNVQTGWLKYDFGSGNAKIVTRYSMMPETDTNNMNRSLKSWTLEGSNDDSSWTVLHSVTNDPVWTPLEKRYWAVTNTTAYRYYRINITANQAGSGYSAIGELELMSSHQTTRDLTIELDSVRYIKPTMPVQIYAAGTDDLLYEFDVESVDKINDTITISPYMLSFGTGDVNTSTEVITLSDASEFPTGTPIIFDTSNTLPGGLTVDQTYYSIYVSSTTIKVADTRDDALIGVAKNLTSTGTGTHRIRKSYTFGNKDEVWASGRKGKLTRFWNVDYRNPERADWFKLPPTLDAGNDIVAVGKLSNRLFLFTESATIRYDGANILTLRNDVGCASHRSIGYYDSFMVWLDNQGRIWARNEEEGAQDVISLPITDIMAQIPLTNLKHASAVVADRKYKLSLGQVDGKTIRVVYDFQANAWSHEEFTPAMPVQFLAEYSNKVKPHFYDNAGRLWVDEEGNDDDGEVIPFDVETGPDHFGVDEEKQFIGLKVFSRNSTAMKVMVSVDHGDWLDVGQITKPIQKISLNNKKLSQKVPSGTMFNLRFVDSSSHEPVRVERVIVYYTSEEDTFHETKNR